MLPLLFVLLLSANAQLLQMVAEDTTTTLVSAGEIVSDFNAGENSGCGMPKLYILADGSHQQYTLKSTNLSVVSVVGKWLAVDARISCLGKDCEVGLTSGCLEEESINWVEVETGVGRVGWLVDCQPGHHYKPFEWGLFLLILGAAVLLTVSSRHSTAWCYSGAGYDLTLRAALLFNFLLMVLLALAYAYPAEMGVAAAWIGTLLGGFGVTVCSSELFWLTHAPFFKVPIGRIRRLDAIGISLGLLSVIVELTLGGWVLEDILGCCAIIAVMKLVRVRSLRVGVGLLGVLLLVEAVVGVWVHYVLAQSYNNYVINTFQSPLVLALPSITPQLYRRCAWLPLTAVLCPGLILSYLRRFDRSRATWLYFGIGLTSFYVGSLCWMLIDMETIHALPFAIISEPVALLLIALQGFRRNEFKTIWKGSFHDEELEDRQMLPESREEGCYEIMTDNLKLSFSSNISDSVEVPRISEDFRL